MKRLFRIVLTLLTCCVALSSQAWNRGGHLTTGAIAYRELVAANPVAVARIVSVMKAHPTLSLFDGRVESESTPEAKAERLFMEMATWPDEVRPDSAYAKDFHHDSWHWINIVDVPPRTPVSFVAPAEITKDRLFEAFAKNVAIVANESASDADRAVALCWVFHLVGDLHQPLHTTALFNPEFPDGDKGGNAIKIKVTEGGKIINLHSFWDGAVLGSSDPQAARNTASKLRAANPRDAMSDMKLRPYTGSVAFEAWGRQESAFIATTFAYDNGELLNYTKSDGAYVLTPEYISNTKAIADQRATLAGYRLAEILAQLFKSP